MEGKEERKWQCGKKECMKGEGVKKMKNEPKMRAERVRESKKAES